MSPIAFPSPAAWRARFALLLLAAWPTLGAQPSFATDTSWTLERALAVAGENNPDTQVARQRLIAAQTLIAQADSAWKPQVLLQGRYTDTNSPMMAFGSILNQRAFHFGLDFNRPGQIDNLNATGTVAYNLYAGGRPSAQRSAAQAGAAAAEQDAQAVRNQLNAEVVKAYLNIRKAREAIAALTAGVQAYEAGVAVARARFTAGQMLKADLLNLEVQLAQTREQLSSARHGAALAARAFLFVLGLEPTGAEVALAPADPALDQLAAPTSFDASRRPELLGLQDRLRAAEAMVQAARGGLRPTVNAFASYQFDHGWQTNRHGDSWLAGVAVDLPVFDGGLTPAKVRQAQAELAQVKALQRKATLGIALEVEQARLAHADARERLAVSGQAVAQAEESAALSRARFEKGALLSADLIGVESRLIEARMRRTLAAADERIALADLRRALGLPLLSQP